MFEKERHPDGGPEVTLQGPAPIEFTFRGRRFRTYRVLSRWHESGEWWKRITHSFTTPDDQPRTFYTVEAAPIGTLTTFQLECDDQSGDWTVRSL